MVAHWRLQGLSKAFLAQIDCPAWISTIYGRNLLPCLIPPPNDTQMPMKSKSEDCLSSNTRNVKAIWLHFCTLSVFYRHGPNWLRWFRQPKKWHQVHKESKLSSDNPLPLDSSFVCSWSHLVQNISVDLLGLFILLSLRTRLLFSSYLFSSIPFPCTSELENTQETISQ